ncbi:MAG: geranylgeranylglyceryl/heptaprenylglyceryl phosphate synthase [archaeon]|nr:geranylgeranylglyceryl/heptaprenylglyceryl phosphate synthase [archaeon]MCP8319818.1 geranylgeranylglyceryl/heptaprenylglyceryl phosphate synthase [archaeon]
MIGKIERYLKREISKDGTISFALIDSENISLEMATSIALNAESCGVKGILVGGSTAIDQLELDNIVKTIKKEVKIPVILFPGNVTGISPNADAILFSSLLNSDNPYFITEAQALGALSVKKYGLEAIPMGYIVIGEGGAIGFIGRARGIPPNKPNLVAIYALAAKYMGMRFVYLEAGSGVTSHISSSIVTKVRNVFDGVLIVGGGIRRVEDAIKVAKAGADILVIGTLLENKNFMPKLKEIVEGIKNVRR